MPNMFWLVLYSKCMFWLVLYSKCIVNLCRVGFLMLPYIHVAAVAIYASALHTNSVSPIHDIAHSFQSVVYTLVTIRKFTCHQHSTHCMAPHIHMIDINCMWSMPRAVYCSWFLYLNNHIVTRLLFVQTCMMYIIVELSSERIFRCCICLCNVTRKSRQLYLTYFQLVHV